MRWLVEGSRRRVALRRFPSLSLSLSLLCRFVIVLLLFLLLLRPLPLSPFVSPPRLPPRPALPAGRPKQDTVVSGNGDRDYARTVRRSRLPFSRSLARDCVVATQRPREPVARFEFPAIASSLERKRERGRFKFRWWTLRAFACLHRAFEQRRRVHGDPRGTSMGIGGRFSGILLFRNYGQGTSPKGETKREGEADAARRSDLKAGPPR